jgi:asparagine synthase (glutamine-hydrolysing)
MCGLVALMGTDGFVPDPGTLQMMLEAIEHRGPDDSGIHLQGPVAFGFRRLSILDLSSAGHQPMQAADGKVTIVFNGEIYNYLEVRAELQALGHVFRSHGDTEVLLNAYLQWGRDCVGRLNGMWAFLIDDARTGLLFGSRDRFGIKPLYRLRTESQTAFASEIKAFKAAGLTACRPDLRTVANFLLECRLDRDASTFYADIEAIPPAHCFELDRQGRFRQWRYWDLATSAAQIEGDPAEAFAALFEDAVRLHMRSDVPVSVHLSGGLDSTAIACASARVRQVAGASGALTTFSYSDAFFDETRYIAATIAQTRAEITTLRSSPRQLWDLLPEVLRAQDEPFHSLTPVVGYLLMRMTAASGVKVVLNGQGADETLGGYPSFFRNYWHTLLSSGRPRVPGARSERLGKGSQT